MFDAQQFAERLAKREDRWSLLKDFVAEWHTPLQEGDGYSAKEIDAAEQRLGLKLPLALREWYQLAGRRQDITQTENILDAPARLQVSGNLLLFQPENHDVAAWGIQKTELALPNPPVWMDRGGGYPSRHEYVRENNTLSEFVLQMVVVETILADAAARFGCIDGEAHTSVEQKFGRLGFPDWHWPSFPTRIYGGEDALILVFGGKIGSLQVAARNQMTFENVESALEINWEQSSF